MKENSMIKVFSVSETS